MTVVGYVAICVIPLACFKLLVDGFEGWAKFVPRFRHARVIEHKRPVDCRRYGRDLRRLAAEHDRVLSGNSFAKANRLRALELAYDDTLCIACRALELDEPPRPLDSVARLQVEADLARNGVNW